MRYREHLDDLVSKIASGLLAPGSRLPPQREYAYQQGIAYSTAARVYAELTRMGLVTGEIGRGTFVRDTRLPLSALSEPRSTRIDLEYNFPLIAAQNNALAETLRSLEPDAALLPGRIEGTSELRALTADYFSRGGWRAAPEQILFAGNGRQAIAACLSALVRPGERVGVEPMTYPVARGIAARLGIELVPLAIDEEGIEPDDLSRLAASKSVRAIYVQPDFQNPLGLLMSARRRQALADVITKFELPTIEDGIYAFLSEEPPIASFAPDHVFLIDSLSKRVSPGVALGYVAAPQRREASLAQALRTGPWGPAGLSLAIGRLWMKRADARRFDRLKRDDASSRQSLARRILAEFEIGGDDRAYHSWLTLPEEWRAEDFAAAAARDGIAVTPAHAFAVSRGRAPAAVRIALSAPPVPLLEQGLMRLATLIRNGPLFRED